MNCTISNNSADYLGGGVRCGGSPTFTSCTISGNWVDRGGGMYCGGYSSSPIFAYCTFSGNSASAGGGAELYLSSPSFTKCTFNDNSAANIGGGMRCSYYSLPSFTKCTFSDNLADCGGGVYCNNCSPNFTNCIFSSNSAIMDGGGMNCDYSSPALSNCTFYNDSAQYGGGLCCRDSCYPALDNTIITFSAGGQAIYCREPLQFPSNPVLTCCDIYGNVGGDWVGCIAGQDTISGNISEDPLFCDSENGDFRLFSNSPSLYGPCGQIGAFGPGCFAIESILDVGNDQGRQVRIKWYRSLYDASGDTVVTGYGIYRRQDQYLKASGVRPEPRIKHLPKVESHWLDGWDYIATIPAHGDSIYQYISPTLCDSTAEEGICWSLFFVRAMPQEPLVYFDSEPDSGYSMDNLAPSTPKGLMVTSGDTSINLMWNAIPDEDFRYYAVYRGTENGFTPDSSNLLGATIDTSYSDSEVLGDSTYSYRVSAFDFAGNQSRYSDEASCQFVGVQRNGDMELPKSFSLFQNHPNPFNPMTEIRYGLPNDCWVRLEVYNILGQKVATLVDGHQKAGYKTTRWDASSFSSGIYFYRLQAGDFVQTRKMVLLK